MQGGSGARLGGDAGPSLWPEAQALPHALQAAMACPGLLAMGLRLGGGTGALQTPPVPPRSRAGGLQVATHRKPEIRSNSGLWGTAEQRTVVACSQNGHARRCGSMCPGAGRSD